MANVKNILVGAASLYVTKLGQSTQDIPAAITGKSYNESFLAASAWRDMGYTTEGLELSYEPNYGEVAVDQLLDAARLFKQGLKVTLKTTLSEATLENLQVAFGQEDSVTSYSGSTGAATNTLSVDASGSKTTLNLTGGALGTAPVERSLAAVGQAPTQLGTAGTALNAVTGQKKERVYFARRVVSMDTVSHGLKRGDATVFPVTFRCLPDDADAYDGSEYGKIIDRIFA